MKNLIDFINESLNQKDLKAFNSILYKMGIRGNSAKKVLPVIEKWFNDNNVTNFKIYATPGIAKNAEDINDVDERDFGIDINSKDVVTIDDGHDSPITYVSSNKAFYVFSEDNLLIAID